MKIVLDVENSTTKQEFLQEDGKKKVRVDMTPFCKTNELVSVGVKVIDTGDVFYEFFNHSEVKSPNLDGYNVIDATLKSAHLIIGHYVKHDINWCRAASFTFPEDAEYWDTAIAEYVLAKGQVMTDFSLSELAIKYNLPHKKTDLVQSYYDEGKTMYDIPKHIVDEYGRGDLDTTEALYLNQLQRLSLPQNIGLLPTIKMMNEFMVVLAKWQANGIKIDLKVLSEVEAEFRKEREDLVKTLTEIAKEYMGDTPFNLNSGEDKSVLLYSRRVKDKNAWKAAFNIGLDIRGKKLRRPRLTNSEFTTKIRELTNVERRTVLSRCEACSGSGYTFPTLKSGLPGKARRVCKACNKAGVIYTPTNRVAGFKFNPESVKDCGVNGFITEADKLETFLLKSEGRPKVFLQGLIRLNQLNTYINTFVTGIKTATVPETSLLYTNFNQTITATGRLSSSSPNFQNIPRGTTFPVKRAIVSRFPGGRIYDADFAQLEFRCAGELSGDPQIYKDVIDGVDVHAFTRDTLNAADGGSRTRQEAKAHTFAPIYGGTYGTPVQMAYYSAFKKKYNVHTKWQDKIADQVLRYGYYTLPTGRQYSWKGVVREWDGRVKYFTQIVNYPVQGFATADIVPIACITIQKEIERQNLKSVGFLTVHDSIAVDCYPGEEHIVQKIVNDAMLGTREELLRRYNYVMKMPLEIEGKLGYNMYDMEKVCKESHLVVKNDEDMDDSLEDI